MVDLNERIYPHPAAPTVGDVFKETHRLRSQVRRVEELADSWAGQGLVDQAQAIRDALNDAHGEPT